MKRLIACILGLLCVLIALSACHTGKPGGTSDTENPGDAKYIGTNGNYWIRDTDTGEKAEEVILTEGKLAVYDHSLALSGNRYFESETVKLGEKQIILTGGYVEGIEFNRYSGVCFAKMVLHAAEEGTLTVSTAPVISLKNGKLTETENATSHEVKAGENIIELNGLYVKPDATIVIGAPGDTASLTVYRGAIPDAGNGECRIVGETENCRLPFKLYAGNSENSPFFDEKAEGNVKGSGMTFIYASAPFIYVNNPFSNGKLTEIVLSTLDCPAGATFTVSVVKFNQKIEDTAQVFVIETEEALSAGWHHFQVDLSVPDGYTVAFGASGDTMPVQYYNACGSSFYFFYSTLSAAAPDYSHCLGIDVYGQKAVTSMAARDAEVSLAVSRLPLTDLQLNTLTEKIKGKKISVMGDSISTYTGISDNTDYNTTLRKYAVFYYRQIKEDETWWMRVINETETALCVNNSYSGSEVWTGVGLGYQGRAENLHNDNTGEEPDIILIFMGTNDERNDPQDRFVPFDEETVQACITEMSDGTFKYGTPHSFLEAYSIMIHKIMQRYPDADIFLMTMAPSFLPSDPSGEHLNRFADEICQIGDYFGLPSINLVTESGLTLDNIRTYSVGDSLHPNPAGMKMISECVLKHMYNFYCTSENQ